MLAEFTKQHQHLTAERGVDRVSERDSILITYGDIVQIEGLPPLKSLADFFKETVSDTISTIAYPAFLSLLIR